MATAQRRDNQMWFKQAIGLRYEALDGGWAGISYERFFTIRSSFEIMGLGYFAEGLEAAGFYKFTGVFPGTTSQFRYFLGPGVHIASWYNAKPKDPFVVGIDAMFGLGFVFFNLPIGISVDWRPTLDLYTQNPLKREDMAKRFDPERLGITVRYTMNHM
jgi:hypothetical protein